MTSRLYVRKGGDIGAGDIELTGFTGRKGIPFFDDDASLIKMGMRCENGEASQGTFKLMDPEAELPRTDFEFNLPAHTLVTWTEDAPGAEIWLARGRIAQYEGGRGDVTLDNQVEFDGLVDDGNMELRGQAFTEAWVRPAETDFARIAAVRAYTINGSGSTATNHRDTASVTVSNTHLCPNTNTVNMPAKTYPVGTQPQDVITDCADTAGKIYGVVIHHTGGSHLCLLYILETDHSTYATAAKISDELADWDPEDATAPVYEPHWEAGKASIYDGQPLLSGLVSIYGTDQSVFVDNANATPYDYWVESFYDSQSVTPTQAATKADGILLYRSLTHVTHRVSVIMLASQLDLIHAGMSLQIKSAAAMGGQFLDTYQTRRIAECQFEPRYDGTYWAHLSLDRTPHTPKGGKVQPAATTPGMPPVCTPESPPTPLITWDFATDTFDTTATYNSNLLRVPSSADCPAGGACAYQTASDHTSGAFAVSASTAYLFDTDVKWKYGPDIRNIDVRWYNSGGTGIGTTRVVTGSGHAIGVAYHKTAAITSPVGAASAQIDFGPYSGTFVDNVVWGTPGTAVDNDPACVPVATWTNPAFMASYDDTRFAADDQHLTSRTTQRVVNNSGVTLSAGDVVVPDLTLPNAVTRTTTANSTGGMVGVVVEGGADDAEVIVQWAGHIPAVNVNGVAVAVGDYVYTSTTAGVATTSPTRSAGAVGRVVSVDGTDPAGILWWGVPDAADAASLSTMSATQRDITGNHRYPIWAHRGDIGSADSYPEQTIEALRQAILKGCEGAECDFWPSSEGTFYSMHDTDVNRTTNGTGNVSSKTDAQMDALVIDAGFGYDAGRHAALNLAPPTLAAVIDALAPYDGILKAQIKTSSQAEVEAFAQAIIDLDYVSRTIIEVNSAAFCTAVKAISPALTTMVFGATSGTTDADWGSYEASGITNLAYSTSRAPRRIGAYVSIDDYGADETTWFNNAFARGASSFQTNDVDAALELRRLLFYADTTAADHIADATDAHDASSVSIADAGGYFTGTQVEAALQELGEDVAAGSDTSGELLISDTPSTPLVFADILQNEAQNDLLYEG